MNDATLKQRNARVLRWALAATAGAFAFGFALAPFYDVLCEKVFGIRPSQTAGEVAACAAGVVQTRELLVEFDTSISPELPWRLDAAKKSVKVRPCEPATVTFTATNDGRVALSGRAIFTVAPSEAAIHLSKTECFCFTEQRLEAGQSREMPVRFVIDDQLPAEVSRLTFRYVFNPVAEPLAMTSAVSSPNS
ncbi:MAG: cytochrome c oxidase assembly protein [Rhodanobacteraceae bacterium]|nr:cytochrome c oxidase assembly protein [Rhodanobacteraceae bacterium]MBL0039597.1 cytochrome c oxidase assembly protein [Xanthomonadales bacterium]MBP6079406.1 cytochrome c oxidase assembly protein [Xanthomonadales bacterium]MBP7623026.1 cytochrome c oxidase assembly protein [Xanthomonadales bacterium]